ncbi:MAG: hypothetical protein AB8G05_16330 [Oligoflexales bacterium]
MKKLKEQKQGIHAITNPKGLLRWCRALICLGLFLINRPGFSQKKYVKSVECFGSTNSQSMIFLHGIDRPAKPDAANSSAYKVLKKLANNLGFRLAFPRSNSHCMQGRKICWNVSNQVDELKIIYQEIANKSAGCFPKNSKPIIVGFSNGGYFLNKLVHHCILPKNASVISIGAAGNIRKKISLAKCASLDLVLGLYESTYHAGLKYYLKMKSLKANVRIKKFKGGHMVPYDPLYKILNKKFKDSLIQ